MITFYSNLIISCLESSPGLHSVISVMGKCTIYAPSPIVVTEARCAVEHVNILMSYKP